MLYYLHGYQSDPFSEKGTLLRETIQAVPITYQDGAPEDLVISKCLSRISSVIKSDQHVVLIGFVSWRISRGSHRSYPF